MGRSPLWIVLVPSLACAQIESTHHVRVLPREGHPARTIGSPGAHVVERGYEATWEQRLDELHLTLTEVRACAELRFEPVVRIEEIQRKPDGTIYWEYGLGAVLTAVGIIGMAAPQFISSAGVNGDGEIERDLSTGYRLGGIMGGIGVLLLGTGIYDSVRSRDETVYTDAYRATEGKPVPCFDPRGPLVARTVELVVGDYEVTGTTDDRGTVRLRLPPEPPTIGGTPGEPLITTQKGALRLGPRRAFAVDFVVPYGATHRAPHRGEAQIEATK